MLICFDIGNTEAKFGVFRGEKLEFTGAMATNIRNTVDQYENDIFGIFMRHQCALRDVHHAAIGSVVPNVGAKIATAVERLFGVKPLTVGAGVKTGLNIQIDDPSILGSDLVMGAVAVKEKYALPAILFDFGTATKMSVIGENGAFLGCSILAGINISLEAMAQKTAALPYITPQLPKSIIGTNSIDSMKSGIIYGNAAMVDGMAKRTEKALGKEATLVLTGGQSAFLLGQTERKLHFEKDILLEGLRLIYWKNQ